MLLAHDSITDISEMFCFSVTLVSLVEDTMSLMPKMTSKSAGLFTMTAAVR